MKLSYMFQAVDLLYKEWDLGKTQSEARGKICAWIYLMEILEETENMVIYDEGNKLIGFCGYSKWNSNKHKLKKTFYHFLKICLLNSPRIKKKSEIYKYLNDYNYTPKELENYFDGELSILIIDKAYRGKGIGKKLFLDVCDYARKDGIKVLQILTDEACNYKFYELCNCKKIYKTVILNGEPNENDEKEEAYIYEKVLV